MMKDLFMLSINTLLSRRVRTSLTLLGIFIGVAAVVALISLGEGFERTVEEEFSKLGTDKVFIEPKGVFTPGAQTSTASLTSNDLDTIKSTSGIVDAAGLLIRSVQIEFKEEVRFAQIIGIPTGESRRIVQDAFFINAESGRDLESGDDSQVLMGYLYKEGDLFENDVKIRDRISLNGKTFRVIGFNQRIGNTIDDQIITITDSAFKDLYGIEDSLDYIIVQVSGDPKIAAEKIEDALRKSRGVEEGKEDFTVSTPEEYLEAFGAVLTIIQIFLIGIAGISLVVGGVGILNTMYTSVLERTKIIGVMKAIGARNEDIALLFLFEAGLLGLLGGIIGVIVGFGVAKGIEFGVAATGNTFLQAVLPLHWLIIILIASFVLGSISGVLPALQASKLKPTDALRYE